MYDILLVEDNKLNQLVAVKTLSALGYASEVAEDGDEALDVLSTRRFDAILMDCQMPGLDGYQLTAEIRRHEAGLLDTHTPIIGLSARAMSGDREAALAAGMDDYLTKPLRKEELRMALARWLPTLIAGADGPEADGHDSMAVTTA